MLPYDVIIQFHPSIIWKSISFWWLYTIISTSFAYWFCNISNLILSRLWNKKVNWPRHIEKYSNTIKTISDYLIVPYKYPDLSPLYHYLLSKVSNIHQNPYRYVPFHPNLSIVLPLHYYINRPLIFLQRKCIFLNYNNILISILRCIESFRIFLNTTSVYCSSSSKIFWF